MSVHDDAYTAAVEFERPDGETSTIVRIGCSTPTDSVNDALELVPAGGEVRQAGVWRSDGEARGAPRTARLATDAEPPRAGQPAIRRWPAHGEPSSDGAE